MPDKENLANSGALFMFKKKGGELEMPEELLILDISDKPFINLVWIGTIFVVVGFIISLFKYMTPKQLRKAFKKDIEFEKAEEKNLELT
jgi:hypothetical protein